MSDDDKVNRGGIVPYRQSQSSVMNKLYSGVRGLFSGPRVELEAGRHEVQKVQIAEEYVDATIKLFEKIEKLDLHNDTREKRRTNAIKEQDIIMDTVLTNRATANIEAETAMIDADIKRKEAIRRREAALAPPVVDPGPSKAKLEMRVAQRRREFDGLSEKIAAYRGLSEEEVHKLPDAEYHQVEGLEYRLVEAEKALRQAQSELDEWIIENEA